MPDEETFALALDAEKQQVRSVTSNAGHLLWSNACDDSKAALMIRRLLAPDLFTGWGIRTLSMDSPNYNPMSYHNGSVWPHDTALIALGLRRYGFDAEAVIVVEALVEAGLRFSDARLPELFCGFGRDQRFDSSPPHTCGPAFPKHGLRDARLCCFTACSVFNRLT
jgi:glycogen debranching enzyme